MEEQTNDSRHHKDGRSGWLRLDRCTVDEKPDKTRNGYPVTIEGVNLRAAISPPTVTIGGQRVHELHFAPDGRSITGLIKEPPEDRQVIVDYGFARGELSA